MDPVADLLGESRPAPHPRAVLFANLQRYVAAQLPGAERDRAEAVARIAHIEGAPHASFDSFAQRDEILAAAKIRLADCDGRLSWLRFVEAIKVHMPRTAMATKPTWSFAGDILRVAHDIQALVKRTVPAGRGGKDDLPLVYVSNPPRHGKSLLLDQLFPDEAAAGVCVLGVTYNSATQIKRDDLGTTADGALRGLLLRALNELALGQRNWDDKWDFSPLALADDPVRVFSDMLGLEGAAAPRLLVNIDEISKLIDDSRCQWAKDPVQRKLFWQKLHSLMQASNNWIRIVMTGFTDSPSDAVTASDVPCKLFGLSMITLPEQEVLAAELVWAYAVDNSEPFPGLLWTLVKSTPGLLGLWAQHIDLHLHTGGGIAGSGGGVACACWTAGAQAGVKANIREWRVTDAFKAALYLNRCHLLHAIADDSMRTNDLAKMEALVPWVAVLVRNADDNWPRIVKFMVNEDNLTRVSVASYGLR